VEKLQLVNVDESAAVYAVRLFEALQRLIPTGEQSGLPTRIVATESVSSCARMKS
jgi:hypothetical protein